MRDDTPRWDAAAFFEGLTDRNKLAKQHGFRFCRFNGWAGVTVECPIIQLTTLDQHRDAIENDQ